MSTAAHSARAPAPHVGPARRRARVARGIPKRRLAGGLAWIAAVAGLLAGVVALNVAVLRLNLELERLGEERLRLRAQNAELQSRLADSATPTRVSAALRMHGYRPVADGELRFVVLPRRAR